MARKKTSSSKSVVKDQISGRLRRIRLELFGEHGGPELARRLDLPARTWYNYETGVTVPAEVMLNFIHQTSVNPVWLLTGEGQIYRESAKSPPRFETNGSGLELIRKGLEILEHETTFLNQNQFLERSRLNNHLEEHSVVELPLLELSECVHYESTRLARRDMHGISRSWVPNPSSSIFVKVPHQDMEPILQKNAIALVDQSLKEPAKLNHRVVVALNRRAEPVFRWLEHAGDDMILRSELSGRQNPIISYSKQECVDRIIGCVVACFTAFES